MLEKGRANQVWNGASHLSPGVRARSLPALRGWPAARSTGLTGTGAICESSTCRETAEAHREEAKCPASHGETVAWKHDFDHCTWEFISQCSVLCICNLDLYRDVVESSIKYTRTFHGHGDKSSSLSISIETNSIDSFSLFFN